MTRRKWIAAGILALWIGGLAALAREEMFPDEERRRENAARLVDPVTYYYAIEREGTHLGYATSRVDTSLIGMSLTTNMVIDVGATPADSARERVVLLAELTPRLRMRAFSLTQGRLPNRVMTTAAAVGDSALEVRVRGRGAGRGATDTVPFSANAMIPEMTPFLIALGRNLRAGDAVAMDVFDRETRSYSRREIRIEAETLFVVADSAARDSVSERYVTASEDTVRAWRATIPGEGGGVTWFDRSGRVVLQEMEGGYMMRRTAFELAFENWRLARNLLEVPPDLRVPVYPERGKARSGTDELPEVKD